MKQVLERKRYFTYKDFFRYLLIALGHYALMFVVWFLILAIKYSLYGHWSGFETPTRETVVLYALIIGPGANTLLHIYFLDWGKPWIRMLMWIQTTVCFVLMIWGEILI